LTGLLAIILFSVLSYGEHRSKKRKSKHGLRRSEKQVLNAAEEAFLIRFGIDEAIERLFQVAALSIPLQSGRTTVDGQLNIRGYPKVTRRFLTVTGVGVELQLPIGMPADLVDKAFHLSGGYITIPGVLDYHIDHSHPGRVVLIAMTKQGNEELRGATFLEKERKPHNKG